MYTMTQYKGPSHALTQSLYIQSGIENEGPIPPPGDDLWIDNLGNFIVTNNGDFIVFNPAGLFEEGWITDTGDDVITNTGLNFVFNPG